MPAGKIYKSVSKTTKRKKTNTKALSRRISKLENKIGSIEVPDAANYLYNAVTLLAGTEDLNYFSDVSAELTPTDSEYKAYHIKCKLLCSTAGGATVRILFGIDNYDSDTDIPAILGTNVVVDYMAYTSGTVMPVKYKKLESNLEIKPKIYIYKDYLISLNNGEPKTFSFIWNMRGKKSSVGSGDWEPLVTALANEANVAMTMSCSVVYNRLDS